MVEIDTNNPNYIDFTKYFIEGAGLQDIYDNSECGYAIKTPKDIEKRKIKAKKDFLRVFNHKANLVDFINNVFPLKGKQILDFGCGTGALSCALAMKGAKVIGADPSDLNLKACIARAKYFDLAVSFIKISTKPYYPNILGDSFDMIISNSVFEFIPYQRDQYIKELATKLKINGLFIISTENGFWFRDYYTKKWFLIFRRNYARRINIPYGLTYWELKRWFKSIDSIEFIDLSPNNYFNSIDKLGKRMDSRILSKLIIFFNKIFKETCKKLLIPSDIFLPWSTYIFKRIK